MKIVFDSALKKDFISGKNKRIMDEVVPNLASYYSLIVIRDIQAKKEIDKLKEQEKEEREKRIVKFEDEN